MLHAWLDREGTMAVLLLMLVVAAGAVTFFVCFFTKLNHEIAETTPRTYRLERISPPAFAWKREDTVSRWHSNTAARAGSGR
jgi:hypothetical protein